MLNQLLPNTSLWVFFEKTNTVIIEAYYSNSSTLRFSVGTVTLQPVRVLSVNLLLYRILSSNVIAYRLDGGHLVMQSCDVMYNNA